MKKWVEGKTNKNEIPKLDKLKPPIKLINKENKTAGMSSFA